MKDYMEYNIRPSKGLAFTPGDLLGLKLKDVDIDMPSFATDAGGRVFKRQEIEAAKDKFGISAAHHIKKLYRDYKGSHIESEKVEERRDYVNRKLYDVEIKDKAKRVSRVYDKRSGSIENLIMGARFSVSDKNLPLDNTTSYRVNKKGVGMVGACEDPDSFINNMLFIQYLRWKYSDYTRDLGHDSCSYELEYVLNGKNTDKANIRETVKKLFLMREGANTMAIYRDSDKKSQAKAVGSVAAAAIAVVTGTDLTEPLTHMILIAWGFAEAVVDVRTLLGGGKVPLVKRSDEWAIRSVAQIPFFRTMKGGGSKGLGYTDYLTILLTAENELHETTVAKRAMDVVEMNIRTTPGNSNFRLDGCIEYLEANAVIEDSSGRNLTIRRDYSYMPIIF